MQFVHLVSYFDCADFKICMVFVIFYCFLQSSEKSDLHYNTVIIVRPRGEVNISWYAAAITMGVIMITTVVGNAAVVTALKRLKRAPAHYPLASLAAADFLVGVFVLPIAAARELFVFQLTSVVDWAICSCWSTLDVLCCTASILSLCVLGWERWSCITAPLARARRRHQAKLYAVLVWPVSTIVALPTAFIPSPRHYLPGELAKACTVNTNVGYVFFSITFSFYMPASVMVTFYCLILRVLAIPLTIRSHRGHSSKEDEVVAKEGQSSAEVSRPATNDELNPRRAIVFSSPKGCHLSVPGDHLPSQRPSIQPAKPLNSSRCLVPRQRRATRTIIMLMSLFLLCWSPFFIMLPLDSICGCVRDAAWLWCTWLGYANSSVNPLVYAAASPSVRRAIHASLTTSSSARSTGVPLSPVRRA